MPKTDERLLSVTSEQLPQYLASLGLKPQQIATAVYGLFKEIKLQGRLTPSEDNTVHIDKEKLARMAKDPALESSLYSLFLKIQRTKSMDIIFDKGSKTDSLTAPDVWHNTNGCSPKLPETKEDLASIEILDFVKFLSACGIDPNLVKSAIEERELLKGDAK